MHVFTNDCIYAVKSKDLKSKATVTFSTSCQRKCCSSVKLLEWMEWKCWASVMLLMQFCSEGTGPSRMAVCVLVSLAPAFTLQSFTVSVFYFRWRQIRERAFCSETMIEMNSEYHKGTFGHVWTRLDPFGHVWRCSLCAVWTHTKECWGVVFGLPLR